MTDATTITTDTTPTDAERAERYADLQNDRAARLDALDLPPMPERDKLAYADVTRDMDRRIGVCRTSYDIIRSLPLLAPEIGHRDNFTKIRATLCTELLASPPRPRTDHDRGLQQNLKLSITCIDRGIGVLQHSGYSLETLRIGELMRECGYVAGSPRDGEVFGRLPWFGSLDEIEKRIARITRDRDAAQTQIDEALLPDDARAALYAERIAAAKIKNAKPVRKVRGDGSVFDRYVVAGKAVDVEVPDPTV